MKRVFLPCFLFIIILLSSGCEPSNRNDKSNFYSLLELIFNCPNDELVQKYFAASEIITADGQYIPPPNDKEGAASFFTPYATADIVQKLLAWHGTISHTTTYFEDGRSQLASVEVTNPDDVTKLFIAEISCTNHKGDEQIVEITGSYREDDSGLVENIKFNTGFEQYLAFFE